MLAYVGQRHQVAHQIRKIISEETGAMVDLTNTVALRRVTCEGICAKNCPRNYPHYWREAWLRRAPAPLEARQRNPAMDKTGLSLGLAAKAKEAL
jgi:hypothetical protein